MLVFQGPLALALRPTLTTLDESVKFKMALNFFFLTVLYRQSNEQFSLFRKRGRKQSLILMIALLLLQYLLEISMPEDQGGGMVILLICRVPSLQN